MLMGEIERLNAQLASKQSENSSLREEVLQLMDRIELIGQEQRRIMQLLESSELSESRREQTLSVGLSQIREEISRASQSSLI